MEAIQTSQDDSSSGNPSSTSVKSDDGSSRYEGGRSSPPPNCAICLGRCRNKSFTDSCLHQFCFKCLVTWSKVKTECPLCKQNFKSIIHNVRSNHQYEEYPVQQHRPEEEVERMDIRDIVQATRRATLTMGRHETMVFQQFLMQYPISAMMQQGLPSSLGGVPARPRRRASPASFRRTVYRHNLWARPLPDFTGRFRDCSPEFYRYNDSQVHRLVPWLNRELDYLLNENAGHIAYVLARILDLLPRYHISSVEFRDAMRRYFGDRTEHFLHELYCFASTPYDLTGYDRNVQYSSDARLASAVQEVLSAAESDASGDSDIVLVSSSREAEPRAGPSRAHPSRTHTAHTAHTAHPAPRDPSVIPIETISHSDTDDDDVMVVGYIKPPRQRTPEVVDLLGSDSDVVVQEPPPASASASTSASTSAPAPATSSASSADLVKLKLSFKRSVSDSDESSSSAERSPPSPSYTPPVRLRSPLSSTSPSPSPSPSSSPSRSRSPSSSSSSWSSSSYSPRRRAPLPSKRKKKDKKTSRKARSARRLSSRSPRRERRRQTESHPNGRIGKRKSRTGKDVKSTRRLVPKTEPVTKIEPATEDAAQTAQAGPSSGAGVKRKLSSDSLRLRSVVKVARRRTSSSDWSDDAPLNLSCRAPPPPPPE